MPRISLNTQAPDFQMEDFAGRSIRLSDFGGARHVILIFNRGFV